jgi:glycosyltransferase involved in cell wall biosynthesis
MKVLHLSTHDIRGGAAIATTNLHLALLKKGIDSEIFVQRRYSTIPKVNEDNRLLFKFINTLKPIVDQLPLLIRFHKRKELFTPNKIKNERLLSIIEEKQPDIIHLHWIGKGFFRIEDLLKINQPMIWTCHDMWTFTGGCHYSMTCTKYKTRCSKCEILDSNRNNDLSEQLFDYKKRLFFKLPNIQFVCVSRWLSKCLKHSAILSGHKVQVIPNLVDTDFFTPKDKSVCREKLQLETDKTYMLFGAINASTDQRKGFGLLKQAIQLLERNDFEIVVFGSNETKSVLLGDVKINYVGKLSRLNLVDFYSAADFLVVPSIQEAFGQIVTESLSCETPVISFKNTGPGDIITHKLDGYLVDCISPKPLSDGINWMIQNHKELIPNTRKKVLQKYSENHISKQYIELYQSMIDSSAI